MLQIFWSRSSSNIDLASGWPGRSFSRASFLLGAGFAGFDRFGFGIAFNKRVTLSYFRSCVEIRTLNVWSALALVGQHLEVVSRVEVAVLPEYRGELA